MPKGLSILGFEPFDSGSHQATRLAISKHSRHQWHWVTRPGRAWKWRMRIGSLELLKELESSGSQKPLSKIDAVFATSLLNLADLRAGLPKPLQQPPVVFYLHENQAAYPTRAIQGVPSQQQASWDAQFALTNLTSCAAADLVVFNSNFNRTSFQRGLDELLAHSPDSNLRGLVSEITQASQIAWPPVEVPATIQAATSKQALKEPSLVVWPHRWEHDKGPNELLETALRWSEHLNLRWIVLGESFREVPPAMRQMKEQLAGRIEHWGYAADRSDYWGLLQKADWVLSTAKHEFFGLAVCEALMAGCLPWLPDRLSYPELVPEASRRLSPMNPPSHPNEHRSRIIKHLEPALADKAVARIDDLIESLVANHPNPAT